MLTRMEPFDPATDITVTSFMEGAPQLVPSRFLHGAEEPDEIPPKGPPAKRGATAAAKKRVTVNQLAEQVTALAGLLPGLVDQVKSVVDRQNALELASLPGLSPAAAPAAEVAALFPQPCAAAAAPHHQHFPPAGHIGQPKALGALAKVLPTPAKVPGALPLQAPPPQVQAPVEQAACSSLPASSLAKALTQQGEALSMLVGHRNQGEHLDLSSSSTALTGKGTAKRERLQQELASGSSSFFVQVAQGAHRRLFPALPCPSSVEEMQSQGRLSMVTT